MREQRHHKNQYLEAEARKTQSGIRVHLSKSGQLISWRALPGTVGFPVCLRTWESGWLSGKYTVQVWVLLWGQQGALQWPVEHKSSGVTAWWPLWSQQVCKSTSWSGAEDSSAVMTAGERTQLEISPWPIPSISPVEAATKKWPNRTIHLKHPPLVGLALITRKGAQRLDWQL